MRHLFIAVLLLTATRVAAFDIVTVTEEIPESNPAIRTRVLDEKTEFSFIAPLNWVSTSDAASRRISLQNRTNQLVLTLKLAATPYPASLEKFKESIPAAYTEPNIDETYQTACGSGPGFGADFQHTVSGNFKMNTRLAVFPTPDGLLQITLSSPQLPIEQLHHLWTGFINSVQVKPRSQPKPAAE